MTTELDNFKACSEANTEPQSDLHKAALELVERGYRLIPISPNGKTPILPDWHANALDDRAAVDKFWSANPDANIAICPDDAGMAVIDVDPGASPEDVAALNLPETYEVSTPRGGTHYYLAGSINPTVGKLAPHIDTRGRKSYVLVPPSIVDGKPYSVKHKRPIPMLPIAIEDRLRPRVSTITPVDEIDLVAARQRATTRLKQMVKNGNVAIEGQGGDNLTYQTAVELVRDLGLPPDEAADLMIEHWNPHCNPPWEPEEIAIKCINAAEYGQNAIGARAVAPLEKTFGPAVERLYDQGKLKDNANDNVPSAVHGLTYRIASEITPKNVDWLWPERIARGKITIIAGYPGGGKSQLTCYIAAMVSKGGDWPYYEGQAPQGAVIMLSAEDDDDDTTVPRLMAAGADRRQVILMNSMVQYDERERVLNIKEDLGRLSDVIAEARTKGRDIKAVIIDPITAYLGGRQNGDSHNNADMRALLTPLKEWAAHHHVAVICISHFNKSGNGHALSRVTDSGAFTAAARSVWLAIEEARGDNSREKRILLLDGKTTHSAGGNGLAYKMEKVVMKDVKDENGNPITTSRIVWDGYVAITANEALASGDGKFVSAVDKAALWLGGMLANGPVAASTIEEQAEKAGHAPSTLTKAKKELGVKSTRPGGEGPWFWRMPEAMNHPEPVNDDGELQETG